MFDQDHIQAGKALGGTCVGTACAAVAKKFHMPDLADMVNIATLIFVIMQVGLLVPKYIAWFKRKRDEWRAQK